MAKYMTTNTGHADGSNPLIGKYEAPIRAFIADESNLCEKRHALVSALFNVEKSNRFAEAITGESAFGVFAAKHEGANAGEDTAGVTFTKMITHTSFGKTFIITREMLDDSKIGGMTTEMRSKPRSFIRAYYKTRIKLMCDALANGTTTEMEWASNDSTAAKIDLTTGDGLPLFSKAHTYARPTMSGTQSNYFYHSGVIANLEKALAAIAIRGRNFKDENGDPMGYIMDTIILPGNRPALEEKVRAVVASQNTTGNNNNDVNVQFANWTVVVNDYWQANDDRFIVMSSDANRDLLGNMLYDRVPLEVSNEVKGESKDWYWTGYARMGIGFGTWKHIALVVESSEKNASATWLTELGGTEPTT